MNTKKLTTQFLSDLNFDISVLARSLTEQKSNKNVSVKVWIRSERIPKINKNCRLWEL